MTKKVNPWIKGTLPRGRHFAYQVLCILVGFVCAFFIGAASEIATLSLEAMDVLILPVAFITGMVQCVFMVMRLHDAGHSGRMALLVLVCGVISTIGDVVYGEGTPLSLLARLIGFIIFIGICFEPTKEKDNPYKSAQSGTLYQAIQDGETETSLSLINAGADVSEKDKHGWTPLHYSAWKGHAEIVNALIKAGADVYANNKDKETPLDCAIAKHGEDSEIARILQEAMTKQSG